MFLSIASFGVLLKLFEYIEKPWLIVPHCLTHDILICYTLTQQAHNTL